MPTYTYPLCTKCNCHHKGWEAGCVKGRDLDKEIKELQLLAKLQQSITSYEGWPNAAEKRLAWPRR